MQGLPGCSHWQLPGTTHPATPQLPLPGRPQRGVDDPLHSRKVQQGRQRDKGVEQLVVPKHLPGPGVDGSSGGMRGRQGSHAQGEQGKNVYGARACCLGDRRGAAAADGLTCGTGLGRLSA